MLDLSTQEVMYLKGVGPSRAELLKRELGIRTLEDLLYCFPYKYLDRSRVSFIKDMQPDAPFIQLKGVITSMREVGEGRARRLVAGFTDGTGVLELVWFQGMQYALSKYKTGVQYLVFGRPTLFKGKFNMAHPEIDEAASLDLSQMCFQPCYNTTERMKHSGLTSAFLSKHIRMLLAQIVEPLPETLPDYMIKAQRLMPLTQALRTIHFPRTDAEARAARERLKFDELFYIQLNLARWGVERRRRFKGFVFSRVGDFFHTFYKEGLPFPLTAAQKRVVREIRDSVSTGCQMNRLVQGDVGSGKTIVALLAMLLAMDNGFQACIMAPTEILSEQHYANISRYLAKLPIRIELLTGNIKGKQREKILQGLKDGSVNILVSTHAVLEDTVIFSHLGLVVIDEQHRFGVAQRARLWSKNDTPPHVMVMTATPIPRTLAMTLYGDLDLSVIDELPPGRKPVKTIHRYNTHTSEIYNFMDTILAAGGQVYVVYPLIKESEKMDLKNLEDGFAQITGRFPNYKVSKVHGKLKPAEKDGEMQRFKRGETQIMVATTVIEVGVDVPQASVMIIENAERFGLSQLHQLRGRVGRGADQSFCILVTSYKLSQDTRKRMDIMVQSSDGFVIAEADLKLRGPGMLDSTQQSGMPFELRLANLSLDTELIEHVRQLAREMVAVDPLLSNPEHAMCVAQLRKLKKTPFDWSSIS